ncbi:DUF6221 family protein [Streptomyces rubiginosohelvolus]|uniref:DUF6221 family protein n=1 Tax=Streptomyces TaxID=1883 RepID=UPI000B5CD495|nr:DUF6221 family protein [Streptomyces sp. SS07]
MTDALLAFLKARLDDDERVARACAGDGTWTVEDLEVYAPDLSDDVRTQAARHDPARTLREVEAKRRLLDEHQDVNDGSCGTCVDGKWGYPTHGGSSPQSYPCRTLRLLALPYSNHHEYEEAWRP